MYSVSHLRRWRALVAAIVVGFFGAWSIAAVVTDRAQAYEWQIYNDGIAPGNRAVGNYYCLYGVGWWAMAFLDGDDVCMGAKTNADGSGGNALPFLCTYVPPDQKRWTPGGQSNYGYPTIINNEVNYITGMGIANRR